MRSSALVDAALQPVLDLLPPIVLDTGTLPGIREGMDALFASFPVPSAPVAMSRFTVRAEHPDREIEIRAYHPKNASQGRSAILHIHGGGFVMGSAGMMDAANRHIVAELGCSVFSVDYRLSPETRHPGALEDCYAAMAWLFDNAADQGIDPRRIGVKGESAGGGLAAGLTLMARDRDRYKLAFAHLIYPMLDDRTCTSSAPHPFTGEFNWTPKHNIFAWTSILGYEPGGPATPAYAAPSRAADLAGLPPTFLSVGALDLFLEEDIEYARRLSRAGVAVELHVYPGAFHAFDAFPNEAEVTKAALRDSLNALRRSMAASTV